MNTVAMVIGYAVLLVGGVWLVSWGFACAIEGILRHAKLSQAFIAWVWERSRARKTDGGN